MRWLGLSLSAMALVVCLSGQVDGQIQGSLVAWGNNQYGQCDVPLGNDFVAVAGGGWHSLALRADGTLVAWGDNSYGQCDVPEGDDFAVIDASTHYNLAIKTNGSLVAWGSNNHGQCNVPGGNDYIAVAAGVWHSLALRADGSVVGWGYNYHGQRNPPQGDLFVAIDAGFDHSVGLRADGSLVAWGYDFFGALDVPEGNDFVAVSSDWWLSAALKADGSVLVWGRDAESYEPPQGTSLVALSINHYIRTGLKADGTLFSWGPTNNHRVLDVPVGNNFVAVAAGGMHGLAIAFENQAPVCDAGGNVTVECSGQSTTVTLDGRGSFDPDGDDLTFEWSVPEFSDAYFDDSSSATPTGHFPLGPTTVTLTVTDGKGGFDVDDVTITVVDTIPPVLVATTDKIALWPPNHEMKDVWVGVAITDACWDTDVTLTAFVASSEPDDGTGDGSYVGDVDGEDGFMAPVPVILVYTGEPEPGVYTYEGVVSLRAERDGSENSRVYSILCNVKDLGGNVSTASCVVVVPHDRRKK